MAILKSPVSIKIVLFTLGTLVFMYYRSKKRKIIRIYKKTERNKFIIDKISCVLSSYSPTFWLPTAESQIIRGNSAKSSDLIKYELMTLESADGETLHMDIYPRHFLDMDPKVPILAFVLGACGSTKEFYCRKLTQMTVDHGWRIAIINRRGFSEHGTTSRLLAVDDYKDVDTCLRKIKEIFGQASLYLIGVSAGANQTARYLGIYGHDTPVKAYMSISNPFNLCRISFTMKFNFWGNLFSRLMVHDFKKVLDRNFKNALFQDLIRLNFECCDKWSTEIGKLNTTWKMDKYFTAKTNGCIKRTRDCL